MIAQTMEQREHGLSHPVNFTDRPAHKGYPGQIRKVVAPSVPFGLLGIGQKFVTPTGGPVWRKVNEAQAGGVAAMPGEFPTFFGWSSQVVPVEDEPDYTDGPCL